MGLTIDTIPAPKRQRTILFLKKRMGYFDGIHGIVIKGRRTHAIIEDPWFGIISISRIWVLFIMMTFEKPTI